VWRSQYEDVVTATGVGTGGLDGVRSWVDALYHRFPLLDVNTRHVGCAARSRVVGGRAYAAEVLEMAATWKDRARRITVYPAPGQTRGPRSFARLQERPTPFPGAAATVGYAVTLQADGYHALKVTGIAFSRGPAGRRHRVPRPYLRRRAGDRGRAVDQAPHPRLVVHLRLSLRLRRSEPLAGPRAGGRLSTTAQPAGPAAAAAASPDTAPARPCAGGLPSPPAGPLYSPGP
jgi:hypothetical protein